MLLARHIALFALLGIHGTVSLPAQDTSAEFTDLRRVGLYSEADRTWDGGFSSRPSTSVAVTDSGYIAGETSYQVPGSTEYHHGQRAWVADPAGRTWAVGLTDAAHTSAQGERWSQISRLTERGLAIGRSRRFDVSAWVYSFWTAEPGGPTVPFEGEALNVNDRNMIVGFTGSWSSPRGFIQSSTGHRTPIHLDEDREDFTLAYGLNLHGTTARGGRGAPTIRAAVPTTPGRGCARPMDASIAWASSMSGTRPPPAASGTRWACRRRATSPRVFRNASAARHRMG